MSDMASLAGQIYEPSQFFYKNYCTPLSITLWRGLECKHLNGSIVAATHKRFSTGTESERGHLIGVVFEGIMVLGSSHLRLMTYLKQIPHFDRFIIAPAHKEIPI